MIIARSGQSFNSEEPLVACLRGPYSALVVDDDPYVGFETERKLEMAGVSRDRIDVAQHGEECLAMVAAGDYDVVLIDHASMTL